MHTCLSKRARTTSKLRVSEYSFSYRESSKFRVLLKRSLCLRRSIVKISCPSTIVLLLTNLLTQIKCLPQFPHANDEKRKRKCPSRTQITERMRKASIRLLVDNAHIVMADCIRDLIDEDLEKGRLLDVKQGLYSDFYTQTTRAHITFCQIRPIERK